MVMFFLNDVACEQRRRPFDIELSESNEQLFPNRIQWGVSAALNFVTKFLFCGTDWAGADSDFKKFVARAGGNPPAPVAPISLAMKTILKFFSRRRKTRSPWLGLYLASYNSAFFQRPGIRYFNQGQF